ncbi:MAG: STAS domain-containing protein [Bacteroidetes bacterium]|nr:STAS domain-containing protein [Bacteroidota bacterium]
MEIKINTKEKFTALTPHVSYIYDNMAAELVATCTNILANPVKNVILNLQEVTNIEEQAAIAIANTQQAFYDANASFVICEINSEIENKLEQWELLDILNITPTESEAWDIVQMEEIERELLDSDDIEFDVEE